MTTIYRKRRRTHRRPRPRLLPIVVGGAIGLWLGYLVLLHQFGINILQ